MCGEDLGEALDARRINITIPPVPTAGGTAHSDNVGAQLHSPLNAGLTQCPSQSNHEPGRLHLRDYRRKLCLI